MIARVLAWIAVIIGGAVTFESTFVAHSPNWVWLGLFALGIAYFVKNGFLPRKPVA